MKEERREKENQPSGEQLDAARQTRVWRPVKWERERKPVKPAETHLGHKNKMNAFKLFKSGRRRRRLTGKTFVVFDLVLG